MIIKKISYSKKKDRFSRSKHCINAMKASSILISACEVNTVPLTNYLRAKN